MAGERVGKSPSGASLAASVFASRGRLTERQALEVPVLTIPLNLTNILSLALIVTLTLVGTVYIIVLYSKRRCECRLCKREFTIDSCVGEGGFGAVYIVTKAMPEGGTTGKYVLKKIEMADLNELEKVQHEAKELRRLEHKSIV